MENKFLLYALAGFGAVSILVMGYNKWVAKPKPMNTVSSMLHKNFDNGDNC